MDTIRASGFTLNRKGLVIMTDKGNVLLCKKEVMKLLPMASMMTHGGTRLDKEMGATFFTTAFMIMCHNFPKEIVSRCKSVIDTLKPKKPRKKK